MYEYHHDCGYETSCVSTCLPLNVRFVLTEILLRRAFFLGGRRGTRTPKHFVNLTGESKNFKCWNSR